MKAERLLVLGAGPAQIGLLAAARRRGLFVIAVDRDPSAPGFRYADRRAIISVEDEPAIERLAEAERIDGVISPGIGWSVAVAARVAERLGLEHPVSSETALLGDVEAARTGAVRGRGNPTARLREVLDGGARRLPPPSASAIPAC